MDCPTLSTGKLDCTELMGEIGALLEETVGRRGYFEKNACKGGCFLEKPLHLGAGCGILLRD